MIDNKYNYLNPTPDECRQALQELMESDSADVRWFVERSLAYVDFITNWCQATPVLLTLSADADRATIDAYYATLNTREVRIDVLEEAKTRVLTYQSQSSNPKEYARYWRDELRREWSLAAHAAEHLGLHILQSRFDLRQAMCYSLYLQATTGHVPLSLQRRFSSAAQMVDPWIAARFV